MNTRKKFLMLQSNSMDIYTLNDIAHQDNVVIFHRKKVYNNRFVNFLFKIHNSERINKYVNFPFKGIWDRILFKKLLKSFIPDYIILTTPWYSAHLVEFFRRECRVCKILLRLTDKISNEFGEDFNGYYELKKVFDGIIVYNKEDADKYGFTYHSVGYSALDQGLLKKQKRYDVVFIGAEKGRIDQIRRAYNMFVGAGLTCFFYVILVKEEDKKNDGIIYADKVMPFLDYLSFEVSAKCLFEIVQDGSSGRTFRMMESIIYNKLLITNCTEITNTDYFKPEYVQLYKDVSEINPLFVTNAPLDINYNYKGDFSPSCVLDFIVRTC